MQGFGLSNKNSYAARPQAVFYLLNEKEKERESILMKLAIRGESPQLRGTSMTTVQ